MKNIGRYIQTEWKRMGFGTAEIGGYILGMDGKGKQIVLQIEDKKDQEKAGNILIKIEDK